jgi:predicted alpha/beta hydrolase family esterase
MVTIAQAGDQDDRTLRTALRIIASKVMIFHAKDDPHVPYQGSTQFAELTGVTLKSLKRSGHVSTDYIVRRYWAQIKKFFDSAAR